MTLLLSLLKITANSIKVKKIKSA